MAYILSSDHRKEPTRLIEIAAVKKFLDPQFASESPQIWTGDFNALTREDYTGWFLADFHCSKYI